jgi:hypothetical protein
MTTTIKTSKSKFPKAIQAMIKRAYDRGEKAHTAATRINQSSTAKKLSLELSTQQVAAAYAWITMRK